MRPGEIWLAEIPFTDGAASKIRPVLILWLDGRDVVVAAVTSAPPRSATDLSLQDWSKEGLRVPSTVRLSRLDCLEQIALMRRLGTLSQTDSATVQVVWAKEIRLNF
jgi:mRNA interferase MazF